MGYDYLDTALVIRFTVDQGDSGLIVLIAGHLDVQHLGKLAEIVGSSPYVALLIERLMPTPADSPTV